MGLIVGEILGEIFSLESRYLAHLADLVFQTTKSCYYCSRWARWALQTWAKVRLAWALHLWAYEPFLATTVCPPLSKELLTK